MFKINMVTIARRHPRERRAKRGRREDVEEEDGDRDGDSRKKRGPKLGGVK